MQIPQRSWFSPSTPNSLHFEESSAYSAIKQSSTEPSSIIMYWRNYFQETATGCRFKDGTWISIVACRAVFDTWKKILMLDAYHESSVRYPNFVNNLIVPTSASNAFEWNNARYHDGVFEDDLRPCPSITPKPGSFLKIKEFQLSCARMFFSTNSNSVPHSD